jgi:hypothetical protein
MKTLKNRIKKTISKYDICCEENIDRQQVINQIIKAYKKIAKRFDEPDEYLSYLNNDMTVLIGYAIDLDKERIKLTNDMDKKMNKHNILNQHKIEILLHDVPLSYLLSLLGYASYRTEI